MLFTFFVAVANGQRGIESYLGQLPFRTLEGHGGIPRLNEIGDCPKYSAFDRSERQLGGAIEHVPQDRQAGNFSNAGFSDG